MSNNALSMLGWTFLPNLATSWIQSIYYSVTIRAGDPRPAPNSPRFLEHRRRIHILVVSAYLLYTLYEADHELARSPTFYGDLGVSPGATEREIKSRFRRLAALHHPDKASPGDNGEVFMHLKTASDVLVDPARRFAYERFGPEVVAWKHCVTIKDFVLRGCQALLPYYAVAAAIMYVLGLFGYLEWGKYWRWLTLVILCVFELHTVTRPEFPKFVDGLVNPLLVGWTGHAPYLPFQIISLARKCSVTLYIAFSQIGPLLQPPGQQGVKPGEASDKVLRQGLDRLEQAARMLDSDSARLMELEMAPYAGDPELVNGMRSKLKEWLVQNTIRSDPMVRDALGRSFQKRRADAPAGARGTR
ncbi:hypothetical protein BKA67DRAFT_690449 [Truncatella angustata]|uniref:J domain-containing protein n=1 Tax=Truncatella angustata TaxID=152316 RepID=A0A9P8UN09_9PEZI|nr:uncharacterized protein BKA67DRAFT_690449 [Truncatella angustata]KAH6655679.1 hypothetical protein BKA67DRAFT_690449 [Truncatella angustata]KAH8201926.1 hypothetical protein TruAng_003918 [Truncatella angustata]